MSTNTGRAPNRATAPPVATKVNDGTATSSPARTSSASSASSSASEPLAQATAWRVSHKRAISSSSWRTSRPSTNSCRSRTSARASATSVRMESYCARKSCSGRTGLRDTASGLYHRTLCEPLEWDPGSRRNAAWAYVFPLAEANLALQKLKASPIRAAGGLLICGAFWLFLDSVV